MWKKSLSNILVAAVCLAIADSALGCGPFFPSDILTRTDEQLLATPPADFSVEVARLKIADTVPWKAVPTKDNQTEADQTADADVRDLRKAMEGQDGQKTERAVWQLQKLREQIVKYVDPRTPQATQPNTPPPMSLADSLKDLPAEFQEYERGALAYHNGKLDDARRIWSALLEKPAAERKYRSTWAAYMLGRSYVDSDSEKAGQQFQAMRKLVDEGFPDSTGLAVASLGWEAAASLHAGEYEQAVKLYLQQSKAGNPLAVNSLSACAQEILKKDEPVLSRVAKDPATRLVMTAKILTNTDFESADQEAAYKKHLLPWLKAVEAAGVQDMGGADRLAWAAYELGDMDGAKRWLDRAPKDSAVGYWLRAKLSLRAGDDVKAAEYLAKAAKEFPADEEWPAATEDRDADPTFKPANQVQGELAVLQLHRSQYVETLDLLSKAGFWMDAAYVAERVLTVDELKKYCDTHPQPARKVVKDADGEEEPDRSVDIRHLLGRRLLRAGQWKGARDYFPERLRPHVDTYIAGLTIGNDAQKTKEERAAGLWSAAQVARHWGLGILATELEPDWAIYDGDYELASTASERLKEGHKTINVPSADELARLAAQTPPEHRWHYRFVAAEQAWNAAALMPDESEQTAKVLNTAGSWIKNQDPKAALKFWKALTTRCGTMALGKQAKALHWFPPLEKPKGGTTPNQPDGNVPPANDADPDGVL